MADGANISPEQGEGKPPVVKAPGQSETFIQPPKNTGLDKILSEEAEKRAHFTDLFWKNVQQEAAGQMTELTRPGVSNIESRAVALAAKEGLLNDREGAEIWIRDLSKGKAIPTTGRQQRALELLNRLRVSQGKPPVVPVPPQAPQPATEVKNRSLNPLKMFRKKS